MSPAGQAWEHQPVMVNEVVQWMNPSANKVYVDGTLGDGGHSEAILEASSPDGIVVGVDVDDDAIRSARDRLRRFGDRFQTVRGNFRRLQSLLREAPAFSREEAKADGILFDLGGSTRQFLSPERGFSLSADGPLDMRMDRTLPTTAADVVAEEREDRLAEIFKDLGEERFARRVARDLVRRRRRNPIRTTRDLADCVAGAVGPRRGRLHPATKVFMALRIFVNEEMEALEEGLREAIQALKPGGRFLVLTYHSLEDRRTKHAFRDASRGDSPKFVLLSRKPLTPSVRERRENPRSRSAKLRGVEALPG
ncbi:MAG: 16S rRNA (cytosine(1402)-N(4))-methyltransferase RsmH [Nitrospirae bacterium]|nr:16S rRNA (cytosine(1402)-N(4))-methyltransferase RsmH [Nitrospirota bacterium]